MLKEDVLCSQSHCWIAEDEDEQTYLIGLTDWIIDRLGDIVFVELPEAGTSFQKDEVFATIESVKVANEIYMPISAEITEINEKLINSPEIINEDPFEAWLIKVKPNNFKEDSQNLMDYSDYLEEIE